MRARPEAHIATTAGGWAPDAHARPARWRKPGAVLSRRVELGRIRGATAERNPPIRRITDPV